MRSLLCGDHTRTPLPAARQDMVNTGQTSAMAWQTTYSSGLAMFSRPIWHSPTRMGGGMDGASG
jgi:hypothetical protein